jgi:hypothetical protein
MEDIETAAKGPNLGWCERRIRVPEKEEDVPDTELCGKGDGVVEEGEVPASAVGRGLDVELGLGSLAKRRSEKE